MCLDKAIKYDEIVEINIKHRETLAAERKRSRKEMEISSSCRTYNSNTQADAVDQKLDPVAGPLQGVVACLSGQDQHKKEELHMLILSLGGRYVTIQI